MAIPPDSQIHAGGDRPLSAQAQRGSYQEQRDSQIGFDWGTALHDLRGEIPEPLWRDFLRELEHLDRDGWRYLLPALPRAAHVVCVDARLGSTTIALSEVCDRVTVLHHRRAALALIRRRAEITGVCGLTARQLVPGDLRLPLEDASVDAFVYHDPAGVYPAQAGLSPRKFDVLSFAALREIRRILKPRGFVYLGLSNPLGVRRHWRFATGAHPLSARKALLAAGFEPDGICAYLEGQGLVSEVLPPHGYRSVKDSHDWRERLKELIFSPFGVRHLAPAYGYIGGVGPTAPPTLELIAAEVLDRSRPLAECLQKYLILPGKVIVTLDDHVVVIPRLRKMLEGRRRDLANVRELARERGPMNGYLPTGYREFALNGETGFVMNAIPGVTFDSYSRALSGVTREAARVLAEFHRSRAQTTVLTPAKYAHLCGWIIDQLENRYPIFASEAAALDRQLRERLLNKPFLATAMHGDYKLENLVLDRRTLAIKGIIDWEHARRPGLPLLDLYYLFAYNRWQSDTDSFFRFSPAWLLGGDFSADETRMLADYFAKVEVPEHSRPSLAALFFMHHSAVRLELSMEHRDSRVGIGACLSALLEHLERHPAAGQDA